MNKFYLSFCAIACSLALSACGSSGSGSQVNMSGKSSMAEAANHGDNQASKDNNQASKDNNQASKDNNQASKDNNQASKDNNQASKDNNQASKDNNQAGKDNNQASKDNNQASKDNNPASKDNNPASKDNNPASKDNNPAGKDNNPAGKDNNPAGKDNNPAGKDNNPAGKDNNPAGKGDGTADNDTKDIAAKFSKAMEKGFKAGNNPDEPEYFGTNNENDYSGLMVSINNKTGDVESSVTPSDENFRLGFSINGKQVRLLSDDIGVNIGVRKWRKSDFTTQDSAPENVDDLGWVGSISQYTLQGDSHFRDVRFGVYTGDDNVSHLFVHGKPKTGRVWDSGKYNYQGSAVFGKDGNYRGLDNKLSAVVDFKNKRIDFDLGIDSDTLKFSGDISGNTFQGDKDGIKTRGGFFGFYDLGGMLSVEKGKYEGYHGAFGATEGGRVPE